MAETPAFLCDSLSAIREGSISLHAPIVKNVIQIKLPDEISYRTELNVEADGRSVHVARDDGLPIQVEVNEEVQDGESYVWRRFAVFMTPVPTIEFSKSTHGWVADGEGLVVPELALLQRFATDLGTFVSHKQRKLSA